MRRVGVLLFYIDRDGGGSERGERRGGGRGEGGGSCSSSRSSSSCEIGSHLTEPRRHLWSFFFNMARW